MHPGGAKLAVVLLGGEPFGERSGEAGDNAALASQAVVCLLTGVAAGRATKRRTSVPWCGSLRCGVGDARLNGAISGGEVRRVAAEPPDETLRGLFGPLQLLGSQATLRPVRFATAQGSLDVQELLIANGQPEGDRHHAGHVCAVVVAPGHEAVRDGQQDVWWRPRSLTSVAVHSSYDATSTSLPASLRSGAARHWRAHFLVAGVPRNSARSKPTR